MKQDNVIDEQASTLDDLGIRPVWVEEVLRACIDAAPP